MKPERWQQLDSLFHSALERAPEERAAFLDECCAGDASLRRQVEALLAAHEEAGSFIDSPALEVEARELAADQASADTALATGETVSHYRIISLLGSGGMGEVYLAQDTVLGRRVALKLLPVYFTKDTERFRRFEQEARAASALNHPNIVTIHEIGHDGSFHFIAQEFVNGVTLSAHLESKRPALNEALEISMQVASALAAAHARGIVHRDIKPENIMLDKGSHLLGRQSHVKVLDFGIAKLAELPATGMKAEATTRLLVKTEEGRAIGTAAYMSPEQARGEHVDARTDIWSLGVVLYEMLTGKQPFVGNTSQDVIASILRDDLSPLPSGFPEGLQWIVKKALRKDREDRYQTARELFSDLRDLHEHVRESVSNVGRSLSTTPEAEDGGQTRAAMAHEPAVTTREAPVRPTSSAEYIIGKIKGLGAGAIVGLTALVIVAGVGFLGFYLWWARTKPAPVALIKTVAVLPFKPLVAENRNEALELGMADTLIARLSNSETLVVRPITSVRRYGGLEQDSLAAGRELGVDSVLDGSIQTWGDRIRISARLVSVGDGKQLWAGQFDEKFTDILAVQDSISERVAAVLIPQLGGEERRRLNKHYTENVEAYQLYLKGRYHAAKLTLPETKKGISYFQQAIEIDPTYALAYARLANAYRNPTLTSDVPSSEAMPKAKAAALKALEIDDNLGEAHVALGLIAFWYDWDWEAAERHYNRALELNPNGEGLRMSYAHLLSNTGRHEKAIAEARRAREIEPLTLGINALEAQFLFYAGRNEEAIERINKTFEIEPNFWLAHLVLTRIYIEKKMYPEALAAATKARDFSEGNSETIAHIGYILAVSGKREEARAVLEELRKRSAERYVPPYSIALVHNGLDEREETLDWLEKAYEQRDVRMTFLKVDPKWDKLRSDSRFISLIKRMRLE